MVRHVEGVGWWGREALGAVPGQVVQGEKGAVEEEDHVEGAVRDDGVVGLLGDADEGSAGEARWW